MLRDDTRFVDTSVGIAIVVLVLTYLINDLQDIHELARQVK
jgi:hypothetical protein